MKKFIFIIVVILFCFISLFSAPENNMLLDNTFVSGKYDLKYLLNNMEKFSISYSGETTDIMVVMNSTQETVQKEKSRLDFTLRSRKSNGDLNLSFKYGDLSTEITSSGITSNIDYSPLLGKDAAFALSAAGKVKDFSGFDILPEIEAGNGNKMSSKDYIRYIEMVFPILPDKPVVTGDTWTSERKVEIPIPGGKNEIETITDYKIIEETTFEGVKCLKIESVYTQKLNGNGINMGYEFTQKGDGIGKETIYFAYKEGVYLSITGSLELKAIADAGIMQVPITSDYKYEFRIKRK
ncbi:hypothetical protein ACFL4T_07095 [candidate division KSB1 bacterium]